LEPPKSSPQSSGRCSRRRRHRSSLRWSSPQH
jgi:hypothetical protein